MEYNEYEWAEKATNEQLTRWITEREEEIRRIEEDARRTIARIKATNAAYQAILDRRQHIESEVNS